MANSKQQSDERANRFYIARSNIHIMLALVSRWNAKFMSYNDVAQDAANYGRVGINSPVISRWVKSFDEKTGEVKPGIINNITDENVLWLCWRWGVDVRMSAKVNHKLSNAELIKRADKFNPYDIFGR